MAIEEFCKQQGLELLKVFTDIGVSGSKLAMERGVQTIDSGS